MTNLFVQQNYSKGKLQIYTLGLTFPVAHMQTPFLDLELDLGYIQATVKVGCACCETFPGPVDRGTGTGDRWHSSKK